MATIIKTKCPILATKVIYKDSSGKTQILQELCRRKSDGMLGYYDYRTGNFIERPDLKEVEKDEKKD